MSVLYPFRALRPSPDAAARVASVPYDVVNTAEAKALASTEPLSFLHVTRAEIDLPPDVNPYDARVYAQAVANFEALKRDAPLVLDDEPSLYFYRLRMGAHEQTGVAGCFSVDEYDRGLIKKHEKTRKDKEDDRTRHLLELRAQTGVVFLTYHANADVAAIARCVCAGTPLYDFTAPDGVAHSVWRVTGVDAQGLVDAFATMPALYIADGHHRAASASRAHAELAKSGGRTADASQFIAVAFADSDAQILPYNRVLRDVPMTHAQIGAIHARAALAPGQPSSSQRGHVSMYAGGRWHDLTLPAAPAGTPRADALDVEVLQKQIIEPIFGIGDVRTDKRIDFVGGIRGPKELERLVDSGAAVVAFSMYPVAIGDLLAIADAGGIMPPKSTWFEPKLRDGLLTHLI
jgi:uncharacterized protein (DUF1015 family)